MRHGFVRDSKDIKYLIMYCMSFMPFAISETDILDMVLIDGAFGYFEFSEAFSGLLETRHIALVDAGAEKEYILTPKGHELMHDTYKSLASIVRDRAEKSAMRVVMKLRRNASIKASHRQNEDGTYTVSLKVCDKNADHLSIEMMVVSERQCAIIEDSFKKGAESIYLQLIQALSNEGS